MHVLSIQYTGVCITPQHCLPPCCFAHVTSFLTRPHCPLPSLSCGCGSARVLVHDDTFTMGRVCDKIAYCIVLHTAFLNNLAFLVVPSISRGALCAFLAHSAVFIFPCLLPPDLWQDLADVWVGHEGGKGADRQAAHCVCRVTDVLGLDRIDQHTHHTSTNDLSTRLLKLTGCDWDCELRAPRTERRCLFVPLSLLLWLPCRRLVDNQSGLEANRSFTLSSTASSSSTSSEHQAAPTVITPAATDPTWTDLSEPPSPARSCKTYTILEIQS